MRTRAQSAEMMKEKIENPEKNTMESETTMTEKKFSPLTPHISPPLPEHFSAHTGQNVKVWLQDTEAYYELTNILDEPTRLKFAQLLLRGNPKIWWHQRCEFIKQQGQEITWEAF